MVDGPVRSEGELTSWNDDRGFGFITEAGGGQRVFVHISSFPRDTVRPSLGESLTFEIELAGDGRTVARRVRGERMTPLPNGVRHPRAAARARPGLLGRPGSADFLAIVAFVGVYAVASVLWPMPPWVAGVYVLTSILSFIVYAVDKRAATLGAWRISDSSLLSLGLIGGWPGAIIGQQVYRHKTRKRAFRLAFWGTVLLNTIAFVTFSALLSVALRRA